MAFLALLLIALLIWAWPVVATLIGIYLAVVVVYHLFAFARDLLVLLVNLIRAVLSPVVWLFFKLSGGRSQSRSRAGTAPVDDEQGTLF